MATILRTLRYPLRGATNPEASSVEAIRRPYIRRYHCSNGIWVNGGEWAKYNNQTFASDSFNGWWHDRPDRAYPAWMRNNQNCARQWYAGSTLRC